MNKYTIYCTEEQTKKAFELGAPIEKDASSLDLLYCVKLEERESLTGFNYWLIPPTAEQMIGWLEEQDCIKFITISNTGDYWYYDIRTTSNADCLVNLYCKSRKEATLAAIDAALDYLAKK